MQSRSFHKAIIALRELFLQTPQLRWCKNMKTKGRPITAHWRNPLKISFVTLPLWQIVTINSKFRLSGCKSGIESSQRNFLCNSGKHMWCKTLQQYLVDKVIFFSKILLDFDDLLFIHREEADNVFLFLGCMYRTRLPLGIVGNRQTRIWADQSVSTVPPVVQTSLPSRKNWRYCFFFPLVFKEKY